MLLTNIEDEWTRAFCEEYCIAEYLINKAVRMSSKPGRKSYFGKEIIGAH